MGGAVIAICYEQVVDPIVAYGIGECLLFHSLSAHSNIPIQSTNICFFSLGWTTPFFWAAIWALITIRWVRRDLQKEKQEWANGMLSY